MLKKLSCTAILIPFVILLNGTMLAVEMIMLRAGTGSINNAKKLPYYPGRYALTGFQSVFLATSMWHRVEQRYRGLTRKRA